MGQDLAKTKSEILKALSHPTRIQILELLRQGDRCVCELIEELGLEQSNVSQHLSVLRKQGLVGTNKDGLRVNYWVKHPAVYSILAETERILTERIGETVSLLEDLLPGSAPAEGPK